jgi:hypothetical protein
MTVKRGDNSRENFGVVAAVNSAFEMECFEKLGPRTRAAISTAPIKILAAPIVRDIEKAGEERNVVYDFTNPRLDASIADGVRRKTYELLSLERSEEEALAGMSPLRPRAGSVRRGKRIYR